MMVGMQSAGAFSGGQADSRNQFGPVSRFRIVLNALRIRQWPKQLLLLLAPLYARDLTLPAAIKSFEGILAFCLLSGAVYIVNDLADRDRDRIHETKRHRPIASGTITTGNAWLLAAAAALLGVSIAWILGVAFVEVSAIYVANSLVYSRITKHVALLDVLAISVGFVLRVWAGGVATGVPVGPWLLACTGAGAVMISVGKRRRESIDTHAVRHRPALNGLDFSLLDQLLTVFATLTLVLYALACFDSLPARQGHALLVTLPIVAYGMMRYLWLCREGTLVDEPERLVFEDKPLRWTIIVWSAATVTVMAIGR
jgi:4-hydroxybenzoate polyprenyltransferase